MTAEAYVAWLDGYLENLEGRPTKVHLKRIREQAAEIEKPTTLTPYWPWTSPWTLVTGDDVIPTDVGTGTIDITCDPLYPTVTLPPDRPMWTWIENSNSAN